jgi:molybdopterin-containing oxidoreductase family iron-sulfur binding subunit
MVEPGDGPSAPSRRDLLRLAGFAFASAAFAGCQRPAARHAVTYVTAPDELIPGRSYDYASICGGCTAGCGVLVKNRDGRPIKLEGNPDHPLSRGGLCAVGQASILGLYDQERLRQPLHNSEPAAWSDVDQAIVTKLGEIRKNKGAVRFLTGAALGPTTRAALRSFLDTFSNARHIVHDLLSCSAILDAHTQTHGVHALPHYRLDQAEVIVGFDADFLGTWISPVEFTAVYQAGRRLEGAEPRFSYHVHFESLLSLTGAKADQRFCVAPGELAGIINYLAARVAKLAGVALPDAAAQTPLANAAFLDHLADLLGQHQGRSLILCGSQDQGLQVLVNYLNHTLGNYGTTLDLARPSYQRADNDRELQVLLQEMRAGKVDALFICNSNPAHDLPGGEAVAEDLKRIPLLVSLAPRLDETARLAQYVCPEHHYLESWNDAEPVKGVLSVAQPAMNPLGQTRSLLESLAAWSGKPRSAYEQIREHWEKEVFPRQTGRLAFAEFWDRTLHDGHASITSKIVKLDAYKPATVPFVMNIPGRIQEDQDLILYAKIGMPDSCHAYNPWLHELPDPISKVTWDNYACLSSAAAARLGVSDGDMVRLEATGGESTPHTLEVPAFIQPGMHDQAVGVALGYGSVLSKRFANIGPSWLEARPTVGPNRMVGTNAAPMIAWVGYGLLYQRTGIRITKTGVQYPLASTQSYYGIKVPKHLEVPGIERPPVIREITLAAYKQELPHTAHAHTDENKEDLWPDDHPEGSVRWGMTIDLSRCTGCSACVVACQVENNIPVVGKDEIRRQREMHWIRIDRYYTERENGVDVALQPMLCQHCGNAPCEVVCPVLATVHSDDGLNQQVYNRCVGTRYCANNCPYKVRRFNWFDYAHDDQLQNLVLNPDVTVRSRGVMEKCTFCVQRIQEARIAAGGNGQLPADGQIQTACQQSCPAQAIVFGNLNDPDSRVARLAGSPRNYQVLGELNVKPSVNYLALVRNRPAMEGSNEKHG